MAEAKAKIKARHQRAIQRYLKWVEEHPDADDRRRIGEFNVLVDAEALSSEIPSKKIKVASGRN